jgi:hypothetical protein
LTPTPRRNLFQHVAGLLFSPREEFAHILGRPRFWIPLACWMVVGIAFTGFWLQKVDPREFLGFVAPPIIAFVVAGVYLFVFRFFYEGELSYGQSVAVVAWSFFLLALLTTPLVTVVMALKGDWNINPQEALQANVAMFLDRFTTARPLYTLAASLDLFSFWVMWLFSSGYGVATRRTTGSAAVGVVTMWAIYVLCKVALAAVF